MSRNSVESWLNSLRFEQECYDYFPTQIEETMSSSDEEEQYIKLWECENIEKSTPDTSNSNLNEDSLYSSAEGTFYDCISKTTSNFEDTLSNFEENCPEQREETEVDEGLCFGSKEFILQSFYGVEEEETTLEERFEEDSIFLRKLELNFGKICRISSEFNEEEAEQFEVVRIEVENVCREFCADCVKLWKSDIRYFTSEEEGEILEKQDLLKSLQSHNSNENATHSSHNKFPVEDQDADDVQIRRNSSIHNIRKNRSRTVELVNDKDAVDVRGVQHIQQEKKLIRFNQWHVLRFENGNFYQLNESTKDKERLILDVKFITQTSRKEAVEIRDAKTNVYTIIFKKQQDAKIFTTNEKFQKYLTESKVSVGIRLRWLLGRRSSREVLEDKGIYRNEAIFGNTLQDIYHKNGRTVPKFVTRAIQLIEKPENIKSLGLYRTSGNLATIQKIRLEVDNGRLGILDQYDRDPDVLTGCLKLFFRELKEPLVTCEICDALLEIAKASQGQVSKKERDKIKNALVNDLNEGNLETLLVVLKHLINVVSHKNQNKMDSYNLAVCWGPSMVFPLIPDSSRDIITQSHDATRLVDFLINYYKENPEEMEAICKKVDFNDAQDVRSSNGNLATAVDEVARKMVEIIEKDIGSEGLYKKSGSVEKSGKISKKMTKKKYMELDKCKGDVHDFTDAFKKYFRDFPHLTSKENVDKVLSLCDDVAACLEHSTRQKIANIVDDIPKKDTLIFIIRHIIKVIRHETQNKVSKNDIIDIWTRVLNYQQKICANDKFSKFLAILLEVFDESKSDVKNRIPGVSLQMTNVIKDVEKLQQEKEKDRYSKYDNVPEKGEASFLDEDNNFKTEQTKL